MDNNLIKDKKEFDRGFSIINLRRMRKFCFLFTIATTLSLQLGWPHYLELIKEEEIEEEKRCINAMGDN